MNEPEDSGVGKYMFAAAILGLTLLVGAKAPKDFIEHYTVFVLACVIGYNVVWGVTHSLHTPLMAVTNAISGIIVLGVFYWHLPPFPKQSFGCRWWPCWWPVSMSSVVFSLPIAC